MSSPLARFFVDYGQLFAGNALSLVLGLISFPILTRLLTPGEYAILGLIMSTMLILVALAKAGLSDGIIRFYKEYSDTPERIAVFSSTIAVRGLVLAVAVVTIYVAALPVVSGMIGIRADYHDAFFVMAAYLLLRPLNTIVLNVLRVTGNVLMFTVVNFMGKLAAVVFSLTILLAVVGTLEGYFFGVVIAEILTAVVLFRWFMARYPVSSVKVSGALMKKLVAFGAPLLLTELAYLLFMYIDRYMVAYYTNETTLGLYSVGQNLASYIGDLVMFSLSYAVIPIYTGIYQSEGKEATRRFLEKCLNYLIIAMIPLCVGYFAVARELIVLLASDKYAPAADVSPLILVASAFLTANYILNAGLYLEKKSVVWLAIMLATVAVDIAANMILLPRYGMEGAALARLAAAISSTVLTVIIAYRYLVIKPDYTAMLYYLAVSMAMYAVLQWIQVEPLPASLALKLGVGAVIVILSMIVREREVREMGRQWWKKTARRLV